MERDPVSDIRRHRQREHLAARIEVSQVSVGKTEPYILDKFLNAREQLNAAKSSLDKYYLAAEKDRDTGRRWRAFQSDIDLYRSAVAKVAREYNAAAVTNAWLKLYEIYNRYPLVGETDGKFRVFFNAELPGASISAFNHYMKTVKKLPYDWWASSLLPDHNSRDNSALGDKYGIYSHNREHWLMNRNNNGDATNIKNIRDFVSRIGPGSRVGGVDLYAHDAGIDVTRNAAGSLGFNEQELANSRVHLGCALAGFLTLRIGGGFVAKQYTYFETLTWNLILVYASLFREFYMCKPLTSRPYNSEVYLIGLGFLGIPENIEKLLTEKLENFDTAPIIPEDAARVQCGEALGTLTEFSERVFGAQRNRILTNIALYGMPQHYVKAAMAELSAECIDEWLNTYKIYPINPRDQLRMRK